MTVHEPPTPDYYRELEVDPSASAETIRAAYTALAKRHHPDLNPSRLAAERMQRLNDAYAVLGGEKRRRAYDAVRAHQFVAFAASALPEPAYSPPVATRRARRRLSRKRGVLLACAAGAASVLLIVLGALLLSRMLARGSAKAAPAAIPASNIVHRQTSAGTPSPVATVRAADVVIAAASYPGFPQLDGLHDAAHGVTDASVGWIFQELGCTVLAGEYGGAASAQAAAVYWRDTVQGDEVDSGNVVAGISNCVSPAARASVLAGLRDIFAHLAPASPAG